jgi:hypothetical protein
MVRYPSRASFFAMQNRDDFQKQYVHKEAGMETTIIMGCVPVTTGDPDTTGGGPVVMRVRRFEEGATPGSDPDGVVPVAHFEVDGVILGDGRAWDDVRFDRVDAAALPHMVGTGGVAEQIVVAVEPLIELRRDRRGVMAMDVLRTSGDRVPTCPNSSCCCCALQVGDNRRRERMRMHFLDEETAAPTRFCLGTPTPRGTASTGRFGGVGHEAD